MKYLLYLMVPYQPIIRYDRLFYGLQFHDGGVTLTVLPKLHSIFKSKVMQREPF